MASEAICFECRAKDGVRVRLTQDRWDFHIRPMDGHPELEWDFAYPKAEIQRALEMADEIRPGNRPETRLYLGPLTIPNGTRYSATVGKPPARRFSVVVKLESEDRGFVLTAFAPIARAKGATR